MPGNLFAIIFNFEGLIDIRINKKAKRQRPFCGKQPKSSKKNTKEKNNQKWMRTWIECNLPDKKGGIICFQVQAGLGQAFTVANKLLWRFWA